MLSRWTKQTGVVLVILTIALGLLGVIASCTHDPAEQEYIEALEGEETGMSRQEQIAHIDRAIAQAPDRSHYWQTRGTYHVDLREFDAAIADFDRAIVLADRPYLRFQRGLAYCQTGKFEKGLEDLDAAIVAQPANTQFYRGRGLARVETGRLQEALADGEHMVKVEPQVAASFYVRGKALAALGRHQEAIADYSQAIRMRPELIFPRIARRESYTSIGDSRHADEDGAAAEQAVRESSCAPCRDPFRY